MYAVLFSPNFTTSLFHMKLITKRLKKGKNLDYFCWSLVDSFTCILVPTATFLRMKHDIRSIF